MENQLIANICDAVTITALVVALAYSAFKRHREKKPTPSEGGFSLLELMVTVGIISILAMVAIPRYRAFTAEARRGEANVTLKTIHTYQEAYMVANNVYWGRTADELSTAKKYGYDTGTIWNCNAPGTSSVAMPNSTAKKLGFKFKSLKECQEMRYGYQINGTRGDYVARAHGGHNINGRWLYEQCVGGTTSKSVNGTNCGASDNLGARGIAAATLGAANGGDQLCIGSEKPLQVILDIIENCK